MNISPSLDHNILTFENAFTNCGDLVKRKIPLGANNETSIYIAYLDMMVDRVMVEGSIVNRIMLLFRKSSLSPSDLKENIFDYLKNKGITTADLQESYDHQEVNTAVLSGDTVLFIDGVAKAILISTKGFPNRGVQAAETEVVIQGSKEAFTEGFRFNTALIRRRIRDTNLKIKQMKIGRCSKTDVALVYMDNIVRKDILKEAESRLNNIDIDAILDSGYIEQLIEDNWLSPFPQNQVTERPDKAAAAILEGRIVIVVDNSPFVLIIPATLNCYYQATEDYAQRWQIASLIRILRFIAGAIAACLPGLYIAVAVYHPSMLPTLLIFKMAGARQMVPFPAVVEILLMELTFELLREAGIRLPGPIGGTLGIVGGLIIGQAAVEAGLVSPIVVIVVALTGISGFAIPHFSLVTGFRLMKFFVIILSSLLGLLGFWLSIFIILIHLTSLKSFGIPYLSPYVGSGMNDRTEIRDSILRFPLFMMIRRPFFADPGNAQRMNPKKTGNIRKKE